jgi:hypothetical protein
MAFCLRSGGGAALGEPAILRDYIETITPDDGWLAEMSTSDGGNVNDEDSSDSSDDDENTNDGGVDDGPVGIRYIDLNNHRVLAVDGPLGAGARGSWQEIAAVACVMSSSLLIISTDLVKRMAENDAGRQ